MLAKVNAIAMGTAVDAAVSAGASEVFCAESLSTQPNCRLRNEPLSTISLDSEGGQWQHALVMFAAFCQRGRWLFCAEIAVTLNESPRKHAPPCPVSVVQTTPYPEPPRPEPEL